VTYGAGKDPDLGFAQGGCEGLVKSRLTIEPAADLLGCAGRLEEHDTGHQGLGVRILPDEAREFIALTGAVTDKLTALE